MHRMSEVTAVNAMTRQLDREDQEERSDVPLAALTRVDVPPGVEVFEIRGAFFFGAAEAFKDTLTSLGRKPKVLVIRMRDVSLLDATGLRTLRDVVRRGKAERTLVLIAEIHAQPRAVLDRSPLLGELGAGQIYMTLEDALDRAREHMAGRAPTPPTAFPAARKP
jgi:sulfate permease, SulP family